MKYSAVEEIYFDNQCLSEKIEPTEEYLKFSEKANELYDKLLKLLNDKQKKVLDDFLTAEMSVYGESELMNFKAGLKTGLCLCFECMQ